MRSTTSVHLRPILFSLRPCCALQFCKAPTLHTHSPKYPVPLLNEIVRGIKLDDAARVEDEETVVINDSAQAVGNWKAYA